MFTSNSLTYLRWYNNVITGFVNLSIQAHIGLSGPRYPSYRPFGVPASLLESCPINLHTLLMEIGPSSRSQTNSTPSPEPEGRLIF